MKTLRSAVVAAALAVCAAGQTTTQRPGGITPPSPPRPSGSAPAEPTAIVRGRVIGADGRPLRQARVSIVEGITRRSLSESTDVDGRFEIATVPAGTYAVTARRPGFASMEFGQRRPSDPGRRIRVVDGETVEHIDFTLPAASALNGRVIDENGDPVESATVSIYTVALIGGRHRLVAAGSERRTDDLGRFRLFNIDPGSYVIAAAAAASGAHRLPGYAPAYFPGTPTVAEAQPVAVKTGDELFGLDLRLAPGRASRVSGVVADSAGRPFEGTLLLNASGRSDALAAPAVHVRPQPDGRFEFLNIAPGEYVLQAVGGGPNGIEFDTRFLAIGDGDVSGLVVRTTTGSVVSGRIIVEGTRPRVLPRDFQFNFVTMNDDASPEPGTFRAKINDDWTFEYDGLFGPLLIRPAGRSEWLVRSIRVNGADITDVPLSFGRRDDSLTDVEVVLTNRGAEVTGAAVDGRGQLAGEYTAIAFAADRERWTRHSRFVRAARADPEGTFTIRGLPGGEYLVAAIERTPATDVATPWQDPAFLEALVPQAARVTLTEGQTASATVRLAR